jgi:hypothetical protein
MEEQRQWTRKEPVVLLVLLLVLVLVLVVTSLVLT